MPKRKLNFQVLFRFIFRHKSFIFRQSADFFRFLGMEIFDTINMIYRIRLRVALVCAS